MPKIPVQHPRTRLRPLWPLAIGLLAATGVTQLRAGRDYEVAKPVENFRSAPEGRLLGTLSQGTTIEEVGRDGRWVKFQLEGWIWGPSLEGFQSSAAADPERGRSSSGTADEPAAVDGQRQPRQALNTHLEQIRDLVDADYGRFYGMRRDADLEQVQVRLRVQDLEPEALERRMMRLQRALVDILQDVEFTHLRIETNRPDGSGEVGAEMAVTSVDDIRRVDGQDLELWRQVTRRTSDGGATWSGSGSGDAGTE